MSSMRDRYEPAKNKADNDIDDQVDQSSTSSLRPYTDDNDSRSFARQGQDFAKLPLKRQRRGFCACQRLTKIWIGACILTVAIIIAILAGTGYWAYSTGQINGQSPPWYPTPRGGTVSSWEESYKKAQKMVEKMSLMEKVNITTGTGWAMDLCVGNTGPAIDVGFPPLCLQDGPLGIRFADHATSFPAGITVGATWNRDLMQQRGAEHARQAKVKGVNVLLGPAMGPLGRNPAGGRNWEGFGADPVLQGVGAYQTIIGIQSEGVMATAKHFVGNEQEHFRKSFEWGLPEALSSNIGDRALHELYVWPFAESVRAGVASVMCSYQMVNNSYACGNSKLMNGILKDELGFQGFVQSDWLAQRSGVASALAGLDMSMPGDGRYWVSGKPFYGSQLTTAVLNDSLPISRLNDMVTRIVAAWYQLGQDSWDAEGPNFSSWTDDKYGKLHQGSSSLQDSVVVNKFIDAQNNNSRRIARQVASEGIVLLKNEEQTLPLDPTLQNIERNRRKKVAVVGEDAGPGKGPNYCEDRACNQGTLAVGWGSGATEFNYLIDPLTALNSTFDKSNVDVTAFLSNKITASIEKELEEQDLCIVFANADAGEGYKAWSGVRADRNDLELQKGGVKLIRKVAEHCRGPVIVIIHAVGAVIVEEFVDMTQVKAILHANLPGQESGNALVDVLFGKIDASGRLPYTIGKSLADYGPDAPVLYYPNAIIPQVDFKEGLYVDYRFFDKNNITPRYAFGYGLSYANFDYLNMTVTALQPKSPLPSARPDVPNPPQYDETIPDPSTALFPTSFRKLRKYIYPYISSTKQIKKGAYPYPDGYDVHQVPSPAGGAEGGNPSLFEAHVQVDVRIRNSGQRPGKEVVQLYLSYPGSVKEDSQHGYIDFPVRVLRNFTKVDLQPGDESTVSLTLNRKDLSYWSVVQQNWIMPNGPFSLLVGRNSRDLPLTGSY